MKEKNCTTCERIALKFVTLDCWIKQTIYLLRRDELTSTVNWINYFFALFNSQIKFARVVRVESPGPDPVKTFTLSWNLSLLIAWKWSYDSKQQWGKTFCIFAVLTEHPTHSFHLSWCWLHNWLRKPSSVHFLPLSSFSFLIHVNLIDYFWKMI